MHSLESRDELVELLIEVWTEVLGVAVTADSDFLELDGTSLAALSIVQAVAERYGDRARGVEGVALRALFEQATLGDMATELHRLTAALDEARRAG
jgi:Phosphopantetheine attachment site